ncbi:unnamed protein product [Clonostachys chloroleuca]|uniref:Uncharacterized protein n=1 Tax=Clonostachys chloroleuca TaxID=1926264 RepID=A0AA35M5Q3_9HYPO|nr:unnamed protein product [Clonostachys chloroleuca]
MNNYWLLGYSLGLLKLAFPSCYIHIYDLVLPLGKSNPAASLAGSFSGLLAFGIQHMEGIAGLGGWRWIFILEGILTVLIGVIIPWVLPDSPETASLHKRRKRYSSIGCGKTPGLRHGKTHQKNSNGSTFVLFSGLSNLSWCYHVLG